MSTREDPMIGRLFAGRYRVESLIATGGMGKVYRARQQSPDRLVALKVVRGDLAAGANAAERFRRELSASALSEHRRTVRVYDFGQATNGSPWTDACEAGKRTIRGGSCSLDDPADLRTTRRDPHIPATRRAHIGARCAIDPKTQS